MNTILFKKMNVSEVAKLPLEGEDRRVMDKLMQIIRGHLPPPPLGAYILSDFEMRCILVEKKPIRVAGMSIAPIMLSPDMPARILPPRLTRSGCDLYLQCQQAVVSLYNEINAMLEVAQDIARVYTEKN